MRTRRLFSRDLLFIVPIALGLSALLALIGNGTYWIGWVGFFALLLGGLAALIAAWRWGGGGRSLAWMTALALALRLAAGVATYLALPLNGYDEPDDRAGYVFTDAHRRDDQAWELASSEQPIWAAFDKSFYTDQYGGLLALSALAYRYFSPDAHRPLLIVLLAALAAALGVPFFYRAARQLWDDRLAAVSSWIFVFYPESILTGGAQMREPFLLTLTAVSLWGFVDWLNRGQRHGWVWMGAGLAGMLLVSPAIALITLVILGGWLWSRGEHKRLPWPIPAAAGVLFLAALFLLAWSLNRQQTFGAGSPVSILLNWFREAVKWVIYQLERGSGQIQSVFDKMNPVAQFLFVIGYGVAQPLLPPALVEPTTLTWRIIAIARALGWYLLLPLLVFSVFAAWKTEPRRDRRLWLWLLAVCWFWILLSAVRAGGDQWDNPRYRLILFIWQALVAGYAWVWWHSRHDAWLTRIVAAELAFLVIIGQWYVSRYLLIGVHFPFLFMLSLGLTSVILIIVGGWAWDYWQARRARA